MSGLTAAVVICTRDRPAELERCLAAVKKLEPPPHEVLVVDNASSGPATREIAERFGVRYVLEPAVGLSRARNTGARAATADIVAYTDDDAVPERDWLEHLVVPFEDERVMAVCGRVIPLRLETEAEAAWESAVQRIDRGAGARSVGRDDPDWFEKANFGVLGDGNNQAIRRRAFEHWRGYEVRLGRGTPMRAGEDHYSLFELIELGFRVAYTPRSIVRHPHPGTPDAVASRRQSDFEESIAYLAFLAAENPRYATRVLRYAVEGLARRRRPWHSSANPTDAVAHRVPRPAFWWGVARGVRRFLSARRTNGARRSNPRELVPTGPGQP